MDCKNYFLKDPSDEKVKSFIMKLEGEVIRKKIEEMNESNYKLKI